MNEKRAPIEPEPEPASSAGAKRSGIAPRLESGLRPKVEVPAAPKAPVDLEADELLEDGWDDAPWDAADDTILDRAVVPAPASPDATQPMPAAPGGGAPPMYETPRSMSGLPVPTPSSVRRAFLADLVRLPTDPPPARLVLVGVLSFFGTLLFAALVALLSYLARR